MFICTLFYRETQKTAMTQSASRRELFDSRLARKTWPREEFCHNNFKSKYVRHSPATEDGFHATLLEVEAPAGAMATLAPGG